ncbi:MAG: glycoside hydrolase family protein, partial [Phaeodactylibacter sp.]|nr:glycoside hydrolase family protein [Phaeodactylibacter sp.]
TIGYGHKLRDSEHFITITKAQAVALLMKDYDEVVKDVRMRYPWATGEVHKVLVNMTYQMGSKGVSLFKKTLYFLAFGEYKEASLEMLNSLWASKEQTPHRARRLSKRIGVL